MARRWPRGALGHIGTAISYTAEKSLMDILFAITATTLVVFDLIIYSSARLRTTFRMPSAKDAWRQTLMGAHGQYRSPVP